MGGLAIHLAFAAAFSNPSFPPTLAQPVPSWVLDPGRWIAPRDRHPALQFGAHVDSRDRLVCTVDCVGEVMNPNGCHHALEPVKRAPQKKAGGRSAAYKSSATTTQAEMDRLHSDMVHDWISNTLPLHAGDLVCDGPEGSFFALRRTQPGKSNEGQSQQLQDCVIITSTKLSSEPADRQWHKHLTRQRMQVRIS